MRKFQQSEVELRNNLAGLKEKLEEENKKQEDEKVLFAMRNAERIDPPTKKYCIWVVKLLNYLKVQVSEKQVAN